MEGEHPCMPQSAALPITPEDLATLRGWSAASQAPAVQVQRARILLLAAKGMANTEIAERTGGLSPDRDRLAQALRA